MSYSIASTRKRLPYLYLAVPLSIAVAAIRWRPTLLLDVSLWFLWPAWIAAAHVLTALSYLNTARSARSAYYLFVGSLSVYRRQGSLLHLQAAIVVALAEEMVFRYLVLFSLIEMLGRPMVPVIATSALFAIAHFRRARPKVLAARLLDYFAFGLILGLVTVATESLIPALILHAMRNYILRCMLVSREEYLTLTKG